MSSLMADLNIMHNPQDPLTTLAMVREAILLGYDTIAVNLDIGVYVEPLTATDPPPSKKKKKKGKGEVRYIPEPFQIDVTKLDLTHLKRLGKELHLFSRITATLNESGQVHSFFQNPSVKLYDIIALCPSTEQIFTTLAQKANVDLITFDTTESKISWLHKGKIVMEAVNRGVSMEWSYNESLCDSSKRTASLANLRMLLDATRGGRGVVISSMARDYLDLRGPYDVANLVYLAGANGEKGRRCIGVNCERLLKRAQGRKSIKGTMIVQKLEDIPEGERNVLKKVAEFREQEKVLEEDVIAI